MGRLLIPALVVVVDTLMLGGLAHAAPPLWAVAAYAAATALVIVLGRRSPLWGLTGALALAAVRGVAFTLLLWSAYRAGRARATWRQAIAPGAAMLCCLAARVLFLPAGQDPAAAAATYLALTAASVVFVALPLLIGRYVAQHERLVAELDRHAQRLRRERELVAERERLRERLRIARDMHDALGHRLGLVSVQAAALEVADLPGEQAAAVRRLATAARGAVDELHELVGALREPDEGAREPGVEAIGVLVAEFRRAGVPVTLTTLGEPKRLSAAAGRAAYRVVEEGLTNAARHAPGQAVTVRVEWESDALLVTLVNPLPGEPAAPGGGHGLRGLAERVRPAGGMLDHRVSEEGFRLFAMLPIEPGSAVAPGDAVETGPAEKMRDGIAALGRLRTSAAGAALTVVMLGFMLVGLA